MAKSLTSNCNKCCGTGKVFGCDHVKSGVCFSCNGTGIKHKQKRIKVMKNAWLVTSEGFEYPLVYSEDEANSLADEVACMHLEPVQVIPKETYTYRFEKVAV